MLNWDTQYELGIELIDTQHKQLVSLINELSNLLTNHYGEDIYDEMVNIVHRVKDYTIYHFATEEKFFKRFNYEDAASHIIEHEDLINDIEKIDLSDIDGDQIEFGKKLLKFLLTWLFKHITGSDFLYKSCFSEHLEELTPQLV